LANILLTGGAGYMGSALLPRLLARGDGVRVVDSMMYSGAALIPVMSHPNFELMKADLRDNSTIESALDGIDSIVHLAAIVGDPACSNDPELAADVNRNASMQLIEASMEADIERFIFASTCSNYGRMESSSEFANEESELRPLSLYAETKVDVENRLLGSRWGAATVLRFATLFGMSPRPRFDLTVNQFAAEMKVHGKLLVYGEQFWRPYVHVSDAARAIITVLDADPERVSGQVFNAGDTRENYRKKDIVELILKHIDGEIEYVSQDDDPRDYRVSFSKIEKTLDFQRSISVEDGIEEIIFALENDIVRDFQSSLARN
jgi:nucleoside-diphosphate-sugar epimerase